MFKKFKNYSIILRKTTTDKTTNIHNNNNNNQSVDFYDIVKCKERRYSDFILLRNCIKHFYPYIPIPILPPKEPIVSKVTGYDFDKQSFFTNRINKLTYFIRELAGNKEISSSILFNKFINDQQFDESFYSIDNIYNIFNNDKTNKVNVYIPANLNTKSCSSSNNNNNNIAGYILNYLYSYSSYNESNTSNNKKKHSNMNVRRFIDSYENKIFKSQTIISNMSISLCKTIDSLKAFINSIKNESFVTNNLLSNYQYLKDYKPFNIDQETNNKNSKNYKVFNNLYKICRKNKENLDDLKFYNILNNTECFAYYIAGVEEIIVYYSDVILVKYEDILSKLNNSYNNNNINLLQDKHSLETFKEEYEVKIISELNKFIQYYNLKIPHVYNNISMLIKSLSESTSFM